jgi:hypothetical protein
MVSVSAEMLIILTEVFHGYPQSFQVSASFLICYSPITLAVIATYSEILLVSLNIQHIFRKCRYYEGLMQDVFSSSITVRVP